MNNNNPLLLFKTAYDSRVFENLVSKYIFHHKLSISALNQVVKKTYIYPKLNKNSFPLFLDLKNYNYEM